MDENPQIDAWNGESGRAWADHVDHFDSMLAPFGDAVIERLEPSSGERVVDVGCGAGGTTLSIAGLVGPATAVGVDISVPTLDTARARAGRWGARTWSSDVTTSRTNRWRPPRSTWPSRVSV